MSIKPLDPNEEIVRYRNHLPHWRQEGVTYFITFRPGDSIPLSKLRQWQDQRKWWLEAHDLPSDATHDDIPEEKRKEYHTRFTMVVHEWLDVGIGECLLRKPDVSTVVAETLTHFEDERYKLGGWVVMPNHVHVLVRPFEGYGLSQLLHSWKGFTAHAINKLLGRKGPLWQNESYDHIVRSEEQFAHYQRYIRDNPVKAKLHAGHYRLSSEAAK